METALMALLCPRISPQDDPESARKARPKLKSGRKGKKGRGGREGRSELAFKGSKGRNEDLSPNV